MDVKETIGKIAEMGLPPKAVGALEKIWNSPRGLILVESATSRFTIRPMLAQKMVKAGLIVLMSVHHISQKSFAQLTSLGVDFASVLFEGE